MNLDYIIDEAMRLDASDIHLVVGNKPILRILRDLVPVRKTSILTPDDMYEMYDYLVKGNVDKDEVFKKTKKLDMSYVYKDIRLRVNISMEDEIPIATLRLIKNELPSYESLGVPDIVRRMTYQSQGLILVTGKNKLW